MYYQFEISYNYPDFLASRAKPRRLIFDEVIFQTATTSCGSLEDDVIKYKPPWAERLIYLRFAVDLVFSDCCCTGFSCVSILGKSLLMSVRYRNRIYIIKTFLYILV